MKRNLKKLVSLTLASILTLSLVPTQVFASATNNDRTIPAKAVGLTKNTGSPKFVQSDDVNKIEFNDIADAVESIKGNKMTNHRITKAAGDTVNPNAYDSDMEDNDDMDTAYSLYYSPYYATTVSAVIDHAVKGLDIDYYKFTISASLNDDTAVMLEVPIGYDYDLMVMDSEGYGWISQRGTSQNEIIKLAAPESGSLTYYVVVLPYIDFDTGYVSPSDPKAWYHLEIDGLWEDDSYTANFSPSTLTNYGNMNLSLNGVYSNMATVNLSTVSSIPNSAQVTGAKVYGSLSRNLGNTTINLANNFSGVWMSTILSSYSSSHNFLDFRDIYDPVKCQWYLDYHTLAASSSTFGTARLEIDYRYDQYENY